MFGDIALPIMEEQGITHNSLSLQIGKSKGQVYTWIQRGTTPPVDSTLKIAKILRVDIKTFFLELFPNEITPSKLRRNFYEWLDSMNEEELRSIVDLLEVFDGIGKRSGKG